MEQIRAGLVIAFDGPDGVGKTTQIELVAAYLKAKGKNVHITRFSGGTPLSKLLREVSLSDTPRAAGTDLYISLAMGTDLAQVLKAHKQRGDVCLVDRSPLTMVAYNVFGDELSDHKPGFAATELLVGEWQLDKLVYLNAPQDVLDERRKARTDKPLDYFEKRGSGFHNRVRAGYEAALRHIAAIPDYTQLIDEIDASGSIDEIQKSIQQKLSPLLHQ